ncbi:MAG TPA: aryldialkylphosphatase [Dehalococcoidia bacterium]|nr:aryldialkylphosphatase [Dehalococcoidia bacterium]
MSNSKNVGKVQTVLGLIEPEELGITLTHEHLLIDQTVGGVYFVEPSAPSARLLAHQPVCLENLSWVRYHLKDNLDNQQLFDEKIAIKEALDFKLQGGGTIVDQTNIGIGRDPEALARISRATGLNIIMGSGYYVDDPRFREERAAKSEVDIAQEIVNDITAGADGTKIHSGIIGELGCSYPLRNTEKKVLRAGALAQQEIGAALWVHPGRNEKSPIECMEALAEAGADLSRVVICHMDRCGFLLETRRQMLEAGCHIEYDVFGLEGYYPARVALSEGHLPDMPNDVGRIKEIKQLIEIGYIKQILLSHDIGMKIQLVSYGGWGYGHLLREVVPLMKIYGITDEQIDTMMIVNPKKLLPFV